MFYFIEIRKLRSLRFIGSLRTVSWLNFELINEMIRLAFFRVILNSLLSYAFFTIKRNRDTGKVGRLKSCAASTKEFFLP